MTSDSSDRAAAQDAFVAAARRYCAVADWFESYPCPWYRHISDARAIEIFNQAEANLRKAGTQVLATAAARRTLLGAAGVPEEAV